MSVNALARDASGTLYLTRELNKRRGSLLRQLKEGSVQGSWPALRNPMAWQYSRGVGSGPGRERLSTLAVAPVSGDPIIPRQQHSQGET